MTNKLSREGYAALIKEDIDALERSNIQKLEKEHIIQVLNDSINFYYPHKQIAIVGCGISNSIMAVSQLEELARKHPGVTVCLIGDNLGIKDISRQTMLDIKITDIELACRIQMDKPEKEQEYQPWRKESRINKRFHK